MGGLRSSITFGVLRPKTTKGGQMIFPGFGKLIWGGLRPQKMRPNDFCRLWKNHLEGLRPQTTKPQKEAEWCLKALENYMGGLRSSVTFGGLRPKSTKGGQMIFPSLGKLIWGGLRPQKKRPNDFCRLWKNHLEGLRPQTTKPQKEAKWCLKALENYMGGLRSSVTFGGLRPK